MTTIFKKFDTLYKKTKTGAIQIWYQEVDVMGRSRTVSGQEDGKKVISSWKQAKPKNVGKTNETDVVTQAILEVESNYRKRLEKDYYDSIEDIGKGSRFLEPMRAHKYEDHIKKIDFSKRVFSQPKLDGIRSTASASEMISRNGKQFVNVPFIRDDLSKLHNRYPNLILDGELYNHAYKRDFNTLSSMIKKTKPNASTIEEAEKIVQYHVYDIASSDQLFSERTKILKDLVGELDSKYVKYVDTYEIFSHGDIEQKSIQYAEEGYEGGMVRLDGFYEFDRTTGLLKVKEFVDEECILLDVLEGQGNWAGCGKIGIFETKDGKPYRAAINGTMAFTKEILENKYNYIGKPCTVKRFKHLTPDGIPRHANVKEFNRTDINYHD